MTSRSARLSLVVALVLLTVVCGLVARQASIVLDGQRYYYLDDDQMISMRYARNLAEGQGLVWNPGERVEGYTNFGWVMVMAAVHAAGAPDRLAPLFVKIVNWALACAVLLLTDRLLRRLVPDASPLLHLSMLVATALSLDLLYWTVNGFETTLLAATFLWAMARTVDEAPAGRFTAGTCLLAGLLPVIRADAADFLLVVVAAGLAFGLRRRAWLLVLAILPGAMHEAFRLLYYGDWLPNTYYLKVAGRAGLFWSGLGYAKGFVQDHPVAVGLALAAPVLARDRRARLLVAPLVFVGVELVVVGADIFAHSRFIAPALPLVFVAAAATLAAIAPAGRRGSAVLAMMFLVSSLFSSGVNGRQSFRRLESQNGWPRINVIAGYLIRTETAPDTRIAVFAAGSGPYFSRRYAIDMLGKTNRGIARLRPHAGQPTGHDRFDPQRSLATRPDIVLSFTPLVLAQHRDLFRQIPGFAYDNALSALVDDETFRAEYLPNPFLLPGANGQEALFVSRSSPVLQTLASWHVPRIGS